MAERSMTSFLVPFTLILSFLWTKFLNPSHHTLPSTFQSHNMGSKAHKIKVRSMIFFLISVTVNLFPFKYEYWGRRGNNISLLVYEKFSVEGLVLTDWHDGLKSHTFEGFNGWRLSLTIWYGISIYSIMCTFYRFIKVVHNVLPPPLIFVI